MKLHEIKGKSKSGSGRGFERVFVNTSYYGKLALDVTYAYESAQSTRHGDDASFDEDEPGSVEIVAIHLVNPLNVEDDDGTKNSWPAGTNVEKLPDWDEKHDEDAALTALYKELDRSK